MGHLSKDLIRVRISTLIIRRNSKKQAGVHLSNEPPQKDANDADSRSGDDDIRESAIMFWSLFEEVPIGIMICDIHGVVLRANKALLELLGSPSEKHTQQINLLTFPPLREVGFSDDFILCIKETKIVMREAPYTSKWRKSIIFCYKLIPLTDKDGVVIQVLCTFDEITYQKLAESVRDIIWSVDMGLNFTYVSAAVEGSLGYTVEEVVSKNMNEIMTPESLEAIHTSLKESLLMEDSVGKDGYEASPLEIELCCKDGSTLWVETSRTFLRRDDGTPFGVLGVARDISRRKTAEEDREAAVVAAEFYTDLMAHDLSNMLQGLMISLELMREEHALPENLEDLARTALEQTGRGVTLISSVKKLTRLTRQERLFYRTDPHPILMNAIETVKASFPTKEVVVNTNLAEGDFAVMADDFLTEAFYNIMHNSAKMDATDSVLLDVIVSSTQDGTYLKMEFRDRGPGISEQLKDVLFRGLESREKRISGLGLTIVKQIIDRYGGRVWAEDRVEGDYQKGANIIILIPISASPD